MAAAYVYLVNEATPSLRRLAKADPCESIPAVTWLKGVGGIRLCIICSDEGQYS
jgi:hypothetical protein